MLAGMLGNAGLPPDDDIRMLSTLVKPAGSCSSVGAAVLRVAVRLATGTPLSCRAHTRARSEDCQPQGRVFRSARSRMCLNTAAQG